MSTVVILFIISFDSLKSIVILIVGSYSINVLDVSKFLTVMKRECMEINI